MNAVMSVIKTGVTTGGLFILYRFLLDTIGVKQLGIWSLVLATTSVTQIASFGLSGSVVKFVAKYIARGEKENASKVVQTATISVAVFVGFILLIGYPFFRILLRFLVPSKFLPLTLSILPYAILSLWLMVITGILQSGIDGCHRIDLESVLGMIGVILHLVFCFLLVPMYGLKGVAYARVLDNFLILFASWFLLRRYLPLPLFLPYKWNKSFFKEIIGYGLNFQLISFTSMFYDPVTKALLSKFGGLSMVGYYGMANKIIQHLRAFLPSATYSLVPTVAELKEKTPQKIKFIYLSSYRLLFYIALPLYSWVILCAPFISKLWIGYYQPTFVFFTILLAIGWFMNILNVPAYFVYLGIGELRWNVISHISTAVLNTGLGFVLGKLYGGFGVVTGWILSLILGSSIVYLSYHIKYKIPFIELLPYKSRMIGLVCILSILFEFLIITHCKINYFINAILLNIVNPVVFSVIVLIFLWFHPMRRRVLVWIKILVKQRGEV